MRLIDFHCDTPAELYKKQACLTENDLMVDLRKASIFQSYTQLAVVFYPPHLPDCDGMAYVRRVLLYLASAGATVIWDRAGFKRAVASGIPAFVPTIEDARVLNGDLHHAEELCALGVRLATLVWRDESIIGGAWNTEKGLTPFGKAAVMRFLELGIIPDVSHASITLTKDVARICLAKNKPFVATHSNAFALTPHRRNLEDEQIRAIALSGGVIGVNLYPPFLTTRQKATLLDVMAHIRRLMCVGGEESVVLGTDLDGVDALPKGISDLTDLPLIAEAMQKSGFTAKQIDRLFFENGHRFLIENLP